MKIDDFRFKVKLIKNDFLDYTLQVNSHRNSLSKDLDRLPFEEDETNDMIKSSLIIKHEKGEIILIDLLKPETTTIVRLMRAVRKVYLQ